MSSGHLPHLHLPYRVVCLQNTEMIYGRSTAPRGLQVASGFTVQFWMVFLRPLEICHYNFYFPQPPPLTFEHEGEGVPDYHRPRRKPLSSSQTTLACE